MKQQGGINVEGRKAPRERGNASPMARARMAAGLTQKQLADAIGSKQSEVTRWERGGRTPTTAKLQQIADVLGCSILDLLGQSTAANEQSDRVELLARLDELDCLSRCTENRELLEIIAARQKVLQDALTRIE